MRMPGKWGPVPLSVAVLALAAAVGMAWDVVDKCYQQCQATLVVEQNNEFNIRCNDSCEIDQCYQGCDLWTEALSDSCKELCNGTTENIQSQALYCMMGCHSALSIYVNQIKAELGIPRAPVLVAGTQTNVSVTLAWKGSSLPNVSYLLQWKFEALPGDWEYYQPENPLKRPEAKITGLQPYTKYKFRVAWLILPQWDPLLSVESVAISTLPYGVPSSAPTISLSAIDPTRVLVSWDPPLFPNGPILSYAVSLKEMKSGHTLVKDVSNQNAERFYLFSNLLPATAYSLSVLARNYMGEGPAKSATITTPTRGHIQKNDGSPYLVLGARENVIKQGDLVDESVIVYHSSNTSTMVTGVALHYHYQLMFVSDSLGFVHSVPLESQDDVTRVILQPSGDSLSPGLLSVDWLNDKLYMVDRKKIVRCDLDGRNYETVLNGLHSSPTDMKVDPYNGFLYWVLRSQTKGGLYKMDLDNLDAGPLTLPEAKLIFTEDHLMAFAADFSSLQLLLPMETKNTVVAVSLDGLEITDIRQNTQQPQFRGVRSFVVHHGLLFWTTGDELIGEEYELTENRYYHNAYADLTSSKPFVGLNVLHPDAQPYPVPLNPARQVETVFDQTKAKVCWSPPKLLRGLGLGAWQKWHYELHISDHDNHPIAHGANISINSYTVHNLRENTTYYIKVRAYSPGGKGPWSEEFRGKTLRKGIKEGYPFLLWSSKDGILKSNMVISSVEPFIHQRVFQRSHVIDFAWYDDMLFMNTNSSHIYVYNMTSRQSASRLESIGSAHSLAVDWFARKLYWSNPYQQVISRANFDGSQQEPLPLPTVARELNLDSPGGFLYWTTLYSVECARLHGTERQVYFQAGFFAGKQVLGLTVDHDHHLVYWLVRSQEGSQLFRATMAGHTLTNVRATVEEVGLIHEDIIRGPVRYYSDRLFWLYNHRKALITDMGGRNAATLQGPGLDNLKTMTIIDPRQHAFPAGFNKHTLNVRPDQVVLSSIVIEGTWQGFNVSWQAVTNVNYGKVFYEIKVDSDYDRNTLITDSTDYVYPEAQLLPPHSRISIALRSFTYWSSSRRVIKLLHSPMSVPTAPRHLRVFILHEKPNLSSSKPAVLAELRWSEPERSNGVILGYKVLCWREDPPRSQHLEHNVTLIQPRKLVYHLSGLHADSTYYFQVRAFTEVGSGPGSTMLEAKTSEETPVPRLLLAKSSAVEVADMDTHEEQLIAMGVTEPVDVAFLSQDDAVFWIDSKSGIMKSNINGENRTQLLPLESMGSSISVDWISRFLYWSDVGDQLHGSRIWKMGLSSYATSPEMVLETQGSIKTLRVHPFSSMLIFTLGYPDHPGLLMTSKMDGTEPKLLLDSTTRYFTQKRKRRETYEQCSCPREVDVGKALTLDMLDPTQPEVLWVDELSGHIWAADVTGCHCYVVLNSSLVSNNGLPPTSITVDKTRVYWSNASLHSLYSLEKPLLPGMHMASAEGNPVNTEIINGVHAIMAIGRSLQPLPDAHCLVPVQYKAPPVLLGRTSSSLTLQFEPVEFPSDCQNISRPSTYYVIYYRLAKENDTFNCSADVEGCQVWKSHTLLTTITGLLPFRQYGIQVAVGSFYSTSHSLLTQEVFFMTSEGAPSPPRNVSAEVMSPESLLVTWIVPQHLNGPLVYYFISWEIKVPLKDHQRQGEQLVHTHSKPSSSLQALLSGLLPSQTYFVTVRAYSARMHNFSESQRNLVTTFPLPGNLNAVEIMSSQLLLRWQVSGNQTFVDHGMFCKSAFSDDIIQATEQFAFNSSVQLFSLTGLQHRTKYHCHLQLIYCLYPKYCNYTWPKDDRFSFETLGDVPSEPGTPYVTQLHKDTYQISWNPADDNGGTELYYVLSARNSQTDSDDNAWNIVYNGTLWKWVVTGLDIDSEYVFKVQAFNEYGTSNYTVGSNAFRLKNSGENDDDDTSLIYVVSISVGGALTGIIILAVFCRVCRQKKEKLKMHGVLQNTAGGNLELATLQELPRNGNFVHQNNILYTIGNHLLDAELVVLPHIGRDQIVLTKFLGSGAFGEVFEGFARDLNTEEDQDRKVAIKTLRKGATDQEKAEFLKEAQLMSNFKHEHILRLLAVCLDNDPNFLILELMEGGDLLSYLRSNRPSAFESTSLTVQDLISICVDVAKGCKYLEEMHFVHRDLAARNCLVSSQNPALRVVKIGDFGLARDIYKNDYYRKEGEGLLPVRWMSPESLVDGVFTTQSDVWAFGVLLWEVMTLGQQPYPARTNLEVLHYVKAGGRLDKPDNCPDDLHQLMLQCWNYCADDRPTFAFCLDQLQELKRKSADMPNCVHNNNYVGRAPTERIRFNDLKDKFLRDSNDDVASISSDPTARGINRNHLEIPGSDGVQRSASWDVRQQRPTGIRGDTHLDSDVPKYLELLRDDDAMSSVTSDGYEIPIASVVCNKTDCCNNQNNLSSIAKKRAPNPDRHTSTKPITDEKKALALCGQIDESDVHLLASESCDCQSNGNSDTTDSASCQLLNCTECDEHDPHKYANVKDDIWKDDDESSDKCVTCAVETVPSDFVSAWNTAIPIGNSLQTSWC